MLEKIFADELYFHMTPERWFRKIINSSIKYEKQPRFDTKVTSWKYKDYFLIIYVNPQFSNLVNIDDGFKKMIQKEFSLSEEDIENYLISFCVNILGLTEVNTIAGLHGQTFQL